MRVSNGNTSIDLERVEAYIQVRLSSTQVNEIALKELSDEIIVHEDNETWLLSYPIPEEAKSLASVVHLTKTRLEKLKLAQKISVCFGS